MTLRLVLKVGEKLYIGSGQICIESDTIQKLQIEGHLPLIREKDYLPEEKADTPARMVYFILQKAYLEDNFDRYRDDYFRFVGQLVASRPDCVPFLSKVNQGVEEQQLYSALKAARKLVQFIEGYVADGETSARWVGF